MSHITRPIKILTVIFICLNALLTLQIKLSTLTKEEDIKISGNSALVQRLLANADRYTLEVNCLTQNHGMWSVTWYIHPQGAPSALHMWLFTFLMHRLDNFARRFIKCQVIYY